MKVDQVRGWVANVTLHEEADRKSARQAERRPEVG
jgi:hypothetical protein